MFARSKRNRFGNTIEFVHPPHPPHPPRVNTAVAQNEKKRNEKKETKLPITNHRAHRFRSSFEQVSREIKGKPLLHRRSTRNTKKKKEKKGKRITSEMYSDGGPPLHFFLPWERDEKKKEKKI